MGGTHGPCTRRPQGARVGNHRTSPQLFRPRDLLVPALLPVYVWQPIIAGLVYAAVSSPLGGPIGAHLSPAWGLFGPRRTM